jgi:hypothetical protein
VQRLAETLGVPESWLTFGGAVDAARGRREAPPDPAVGTPRVSAGSGLPYEVRVWLQSELLDYTKAGVDGDDFADARRLLESDEFQRFYSGGQARARSAEDMLKGLRFAAEAIRAELRSRGYKLAAEPTPDRPMKPPLATRRRSGRSSSASSSRSSAACSPPTR